MIRMRKDLIDLYKTYSIVQAIRDDDKGEATKDAFEKYKSALMPYLTEEEQEARKEVVKRLHEFVAKGPLRVRPMDHTSQSRSKLQEAVRRVKTQQPVRWKRYRK